jgi:hypothetical protein
VANVFFPTKTPNKYLKSKRIYQYDFNVDEKWKYLGDISDSLSNSIYVLQCKRGFIADNSIGLCWLDIPTNKYYVLDGQVKKNLFKGIDNNTSGLLYYIDRDVFWSYNLITNEWVKNSLKDSDWHMGSGQLYTPTEEYSLLDKIALSLMITFFVALVIKLGFKNFDSISFIKSI